MSDPDESPGDRDRERREDFPSRRRELRALSLAAILLVGGALRCWDLGRTSLWYDEVVTMRVARSESIPQLVARLDQIDGTRAPLHPLLLQAWLRVFGPSDLAGRSLSVLCGLITLVVVDVLGRRAFDEGTGRWAAWLAAVCPPLVYYSRETRMYAWLVLLTCLSWLVFLSFRRTARPAQCIGYGICLASLAYSHPLGIFMIAAQGLAYLLVRSALRLPFRWWLAIQLSMILAIVPWLGRYLDHGTDYPIPRYPIQFLLAVPIEFIGGNRVVLVICLAIVAAGLPSLVFADGRRRLMLTAPAENVILMTWAATPPLLMYLYSYLAHPIFGPPRYHLFIAPAYLILVAHGLMRLPALLRWPAAAVGLVLSLSMIQADPYTQSVKADWRGLAAWLSRRETRGQDGQDPPPVVVVVHPSDPRFPRDQVEAARYYLDPPFRVVSSAGSPESIVGESATYEVDCLSKPRQGVLADRLSPTQGDAPEAHEFYGLRVVRRERASGGHRGGH